MNFLFLVFFAQFLTHIYFWMSHCFLVVWMLFLSVFWFWDCLGLGLFIWLFGGWFGGFGGCWFEKFLFFWPKTIYAQPRNSSLSFGVERCSSFVGSGYEVVFVASPSWWSDDESWKRWWFNCKKFNRDCYGLELPIWELVCVCWMARYTIESCFCTNEEKSRRFLIQ